MLKAVFTDRDGVINRPIVRNGKPFAPTRLQEFEILPGVEDALNLLKKAGYMTIVVTNQPDIATGKQNVDFLNYLNEYLKRNFAIHSIRVCPHKEEDSCCCRKPNTGLIMKAARDFNINVPSSFMVGDRWRDIQCGQRAGCKRNFFIDYGYDEKMPDKPYIKVNSLLECANEIIKIS